MIQFKLLQNLLHGGYQIAVRKEKVQSDNSIRSSTVIYDSCMNA